MDHAVGDDDIRAPVRKWKSQIVSHNDGTMITLGGKSHRDAAPVEADTRNSSSRQEIEHATRPEFVYSHRWTQHDLVIWDNRAAMHRVRRFDDLTIVRDMRRTTTRSDGPTAAQEAA